MNPRLIAELKRELAGRGYAPNGHAPNGSMWLDDAYLATIEIAELFDTLIVRREKIFRSTPVVGPELSRQSYEDVVGAVDAIKAVVSRLTLP